MVANTGALDYTLHPGDVEQWDFHNWSFHQSIPAITGSWPEPFTHGYRGKISPVIVAYSNGLEGEAENLRSRLSGSGVTGIDVKNFTAIPESAKESANLFLLGTPDDGLISELNSNWKRLGFFAYFENGSLVVLNSNGQVSAKYGTGSGMIQATQNPWNPNGIGADENVVWLVAGADVSGVKATVNVLLNHLDELKYAFAAVVAGGKVIKLPR